MASAFLREEPERLVRGISASTLLPLDFVLEDFHAYYPNRIRSGIGQATTFALKYL